MSVTFDLYLANEEKNKKLKSLLKILLYCFCMDFLKVEPFKGPRCRIQKNLFAEMKCNICKYVAISGPIKQP